VRIKDKRKKIKGKRKMEKGKRGKVNFRFQ
jgi:hypothetical protein